MCYKLLNPINSDLYEDMYNAFVDAGTTPDDKTLDSLTDAIDKVKNDAYAQGMNAANNADIGSITTCRNGGTVGDNWVCTSKMAIITCNATGNCGASNGEGRGYLIIAVDGVRKATDSTWCNHEEKSLSISGASFSMTKGQKVSCWGDGSGDAWGSKTGFSATVWLLD